MKLRASGAKDGMSRREFLKVIRTKLPGLWPGLPGKVNSSNIVPLDPAYPARGGKGFAGHGPVKTHGIPVIDKERCTGCGLCALDCETKALVINRISGEETYQLLFREEACNACRVCEESCPEHCLQWVGKEPENNGAGEKVKIIFEDELSRCTKCGISLFPRSMVKKLEAKILLDGGTTWQFSLCPSCRIKTQFQKDMARKTNI